MAELCRLCKNLDTQRAWAQRDLGRLKKVASRARRPDNIADLLAAAKTDVVDKEAAFEEHVWEAHEGSPQLGRPAKPVGVQRRGVAGKKPCALCGKQVSPTQRREHTAPSGEPCPGVAQKSVPVQVHLDDVPPVLVAPHYAAKKGECRECGRWLPGERSLCGRCSVKAAS